MRRPSLETEVDKALNAGSLQWRGWVGTRLGFLCPAASRLGERGDSNWRGCL